MDIDRIQRGSPADLSVTFYGDETPTNADGAVTYVVKNRAGTTIASGTATNSATGVYKFTLAAQAVLGTLTIAWSGTFQGSPVTITSYAEVISGVYFSVAELRAFDSALANTTKYPNSKLQDARTSAEMDFERICGRAFLPRYNWEVLSGEGCRELWLEKPEFLRLISLSVGVSPDIADWSSRTLLKVPDNLRSVRLPLYEYWPVGDYNVAIEYEYGRDTVPFDIKRAALKFARYKLVSDQSRIDERATVMQVPEFGSFSLATPGFRGSYTGIPDVDVVLKEYELPGGAW